MPAPVVIDNPLLNSPYREPARHFRFDAHDQITSTIDPGRRGSSYFLPIAAPKKRGAKGLFDEVGARGGRPHRGQGEGAGPGGRGEGEVSPPPPIHRGVRA